MSPFIAAPFSTALVLAVLVMNAAHAGESFGRLFLTPDQRRALDALRDPNAPRPVTDLATNALPAGTPADPTIVLNGVVRRSRGPDVVWVNGARVSRDPGQPVQLRGGPDRDNRVTLGDAGGTVGRLKPGQSWNPATGRVANCFGCTAPARTTDLTTDLVAPLEPAPASKSAEVLPASASSTTQP